MEDLSCSRVPSGSDRAAEARLLGRGSLTLLEVVIRQARMLRAEDRREAAARAKGSKPPPPCPRNPAAVAAQVQMIATVIEPNDVQAGLQKVLAVVVGVTRVLETVMTHPKILAGIETAAAVGKEVDRHVRAIDAPGYTPYFEARGYDAFSARFRAGMIQHFARRRLAADQDRRVALKAFHNLAKRRRWQPALRRQALLLYEHSPDAGILKETCRACPALQSEFAALLDRARKGERSAGSELITMAARLAPNVPSARGRPLSLDSALHQSFLYMTSDERTSQAYTYGLVPVIEDGVSDFIDDATLATRAELRCPSFNPVSARRAVRTLLKREAILLAETR